MIKLLLQPEAQLAQIWSILLWLWLWLWLRLWLGLWLELWLLVVGRLL